MALRDRKLDPVSGDYIKNAVGGYEHTTTIQTKVYHQLKGRRGAWWGDAGAGSDLYLVLEQGVTRDSIIFARNAVRTALQRFVDQGLAKDLSVEAAGDARGRITLTSRITDISAGELDISDLTAFDV